LNTLIINPFKQKTLAVNTGKRNHIPTPRGTIKKVWPTHKTITQINELSDKIKYLWFTKPKDENLYFLTLTTQQSQTGLLDSELMYRIKLFFQHRKEITKYVNCVERQRETGDIHFHIVYCSITRLQIKKSLGRWSKLCEAVQPNHPALLDVKHLNNANKVSQYISKYVRKQLASYTSEQLEAKMFKLEQAYMRKDDINPKTGKPFGYKPPYNSYFWCRTMSASSGLSKVARDKINWRFPIQFNKFLEIPRIKFHDYYDEHLYNEKILMRAKWLAKALKRAGYEFQC